MILTIYQAKIFYDLCVREGLSTDKIELRIGDVKCIRFPEGNIGESRSSPPDAVRFYRDLEHFREEYELI